ncbi:dirigent protein 22-like [Salvia miltiorrhiza]|uniref:dirigent protein 22-like n=1 Tax=Salvia miltiorrhiza TaxID=226208 RepID=UPI0025ACA60C|nr:dirigent protein 22-like [Salvia miltiorrhiza]
MLKFSIVFILMLTIASVKSKNPNNVTKFRIYLHLFFRVPNANAYEVARANITADSPTSFGLVVAGDTLITSGLDMKTGILGRAQGYTVYTDLNEIARKLNAEFIFTAGKYRGSSLMVLGRVNHELAIVGGTGAFRMAQGYVNSTTYLNDPRTGYILLVFDFYVISRL